VDLSNFPQGLLGLLGLRSGGATVGAFSETLTPTLDLFDFYVQLRRESRALTQFAVAAGTQLFVEAVPPGEIWFVTEFNVGGNTGAGGALSCVPLIYVNANAFTLSNTPIAFGAATPFSMGAEQMPKWLPPGSRFGAQVFTFAGGFNIGGAINFARLRI